MSYAYGGCPMRPHCDCDQNICRQSASVQPANPCPYCGEPLADDVHAGCLTEAYRDWAGKENAFRDRIAKSALDAAQYHAEGDTWVDLSRLPDDDEGHDDYDEAIVTWEYATGYWRSNGYRIADAVLEVIRADGVQS